MSRSTPTGLGCQTDAQREQQQPSLQSTSLTQTRFVLFFFLKPRNYKSFLDFFFLDYHFSVKTAKKNKQNKGQN